MICKFTLPLLSVLLLVNYPSQKCYAQGSTSAKAGYAKPKWTVSDPFEQKVFIENNEEQFDGRTNSKKDKVLFSTRINEVYLYFTSTGITYRNDKYPASDVKRKDKDEDLDAKPVKPETSFYSISWEGANKQTSVLAEDEATFYYTYPQSNKHTTIAHAFKKLLFKDIYPGINIEYSFPEKKKGLEYKIIVHPGADLSLVKMLYNDAEKIKMTSDGNIETESSFGKFTDHAPAITYYTDFNETPTCSFNMNGNEVSYAANYDHTKTLVIDPWMVNPGYTNYNAGYDICYDLRGNVYAYGSFSPYQEIKINSAGVIQWIFSIPNPDVQYGDFAVDEATGISYDGSCSSPSIYKVDTAGIQTGSFLIGSTMNELWRMAFNTCVNKLVIAGGGTSSTNEVCLLDTGMTTLQPFDVLATTEGHHDISLLAIDNTNNYVYFAYMRSVTYATFNNVLVKAAYPNLSTVSYIVPDGFSFYEAPTVNYVDGVTGHTASMNGAYASPNWIYLYDGSLLKKFNKSTGALAGTKTISPTNFSWGGIDVDLCDNFYIGNADTIMVYDSSLNSIGTILAPNHIYDLHIAPNNTLIASGSSFVSSFIITTNPVSVTFTTVPTSCSASNGKATAFISGCGNDSSTYTYLWSNGATTQSDTGLGAGTYTVKVFAGCDFFYTDSVTISGSSGGGMTLTTSQSNLHCFGETNGSASVSVTGGTSPYTYSWTNGSTATSVSNLSAGTYSITVYDNGGCASSLITITQPTALNSASTFSNIACFGVNNGNATVTVSGGTGAYTYAWSPSVSSGSSATSLSAGTYTVTITDSNGCIKKDTITITQPVALTNTLSHNNISCYAKNDGSASVTVSGGTGPYTYSWSPSGGSNSSATSLSVGTYTITVKDSKGCIIIDTAIITQPPKISVSITGKDSLCSGDNEILTASGGGTYLWSTSQTTSTISITVTTTKTYTCTVTAGGCSADTTFTVYAIPNLSLNLAVSHDSICKGDSATLSETGGTTYKWSTGSTSSSITVKPLTTTTYTLYASNQCNNDTIKGTIYVLPPPVATISGNDTVCKGSSTTLTAGGGGTYTWSNGSTSSSITVTPSKDTTYIVKVSNGACFALASLKVTVNNINATISGGNTTCVGDSVTLSATGGRTYSWSTGSTNSSIVVYPKGDSTYSVTISANGCTQTLTKLVTITSPFLYACCDTIISEGDSVIIHVSGGGSYKWIPPTGLSCTACPNPVASPSVTTSYTVTSIDSAGCEVERVVIVAVENSCHNFIVPNVFTPNGDGRNDAFYIYASGTSGYSIKIYDRWGVMMYNSTNPDVYWTGTTKGGSKAPDGVYYYIIKATCPNQNYDKTGFVQVIR